MPWACEGYSWRGLPSLVDASWMPPLIVWGQDAIPHTFWVAGCYSGRTRASVWAWTRGNDLGSVTKITLPNTAKQISENFVVQSIMQTTVSKARSLQKMSDGFPRPSACSVFSPDLEQSSARSRRALILAWPWPVLSTRSLQGCVVKSRVELLWPTTLNLCLNTIKGWPTMLNLWLLFWILGIWSCPSQLVIFYLFF